jgi:Spy/CpxP family protein refolding chaperone
MSYSEGFFKNMTYVAVGALAVALSVPALAQDAAKPAEAKAEASAEQPAHCGPEGNHALLERMTKAFGLSCEQKFQLEPYLHDEESVSKPLLAFGAFTPEEKTAFMLKVKIAARNQIKPMLTPEQQNLMDQDIDSVSKGGSGVKGDSGEAKKGGKKAEGGEAKKGGSKKGKKAVKIAPPFEGQQALCDAVNKYSAFSADQKRELVLEVKKASLRDPSQLTPEQQKQIEADIQKLSASGTQGK